MMPERSARALRSGMQHALQYAGLVVALLALSCGVSAVEEAPLDFSFTKNAPGEMVSLEGFRLHVDCKGDGEVTILFEAGLGGSALEWQPIQQAVISRSTACIYDRAGYAFSDPSPRPRDAINLALEADQMLQELHRDGPLLLVGHSFGGFVARLLAERRAEDMVGLVLVDASHENQLERLEKVQGQTLMPRSSNFVVSPAEVPEALPVETKRRIQAFSRMRKTYAALHAEMRYFRLSADEVRQSRAVVDYPVIVLTRGRDLYGGQRNGALKTAIWTELQSDLALLSTQGRVVIAHASGHHVHADEPGLVIDTILSLLDDFRESRQPVSDR